MLIRKNRCFAYPVLSNHTKDYKKGSLTATINCITKFNGYIVTVECKIEDNKDIENLVGTGECCYVCHVECPSTNFRKIYKSNKPKIEINLPSENICDKVEFSVDLIAEREIVNFSSETLSAPLSKMKFDFDKGAFIAIGPQYTKKFPRLSEESSGESSSIISIIKSENDFPSIDVVLDNSNKIEIFLCKNAYETYARLKRDSKSISLLSQIFILPALVEVLNQLKNDDENDYCDKKWYQTLDTITSKSPQINASLAESLDSQKTMLEIAQTILQDPLPKATQSIETMFFDSEDDN